MAQVLAVRMTDEYFASPLFEGGSIIVTRPGEVVVENGHGFYAAAAAGACRLAARATQGGVKRRVVLVEVDESDIVHRRALRFSGFNELRIRRGRIVRELDEREVGRLAHGDYLYDVVGFAGKVATQCLGCGLSVEGTLPEAREAFALHECEAAA